MLGLYLKIWEWELIFGCAVKAFSSLGVHSPCRVPITSKSSKFKGETQHYLVKLPKSTGARYYCPKIQRVPGTLGTHANSSPESLIQNSHQLCQTFEIQSLCHHLVCFKRSHACLAIGASPDFS